MFNAEAYHSTYGDANTDAEKGWPPILCVCICLTISIMLKFMANTAANANAKYEHAFTNTH